MRGCTLRHCVPPNFEIVKSLPQQKNVENHIALRYSCCCLCHLIDSNIRSRSMKFIAAKAYIFTPVVSLSFEHHAGDRTILLSSAPNLRENILEMDRGLSPLFHFHQSHRRTCSSTAV
ncbi:hypothetical protein TNCV_1086011 [Trichonephila clavipes]|nr:hypothetical protein TNCV_1086011 [Trichonephila clavipes]